MDGYLSDNNDPETGSLFRTEASSLISKSPAREASRSLLSLGAMLDQYCLNEEEVFVEQEKVRLEQEKCRVNSLLQGMQNLRELLWVPCDCNKCAPTKGAAHASEVTIKGFLGLDIEMQVKQYLLKYGPILKQMILSVETEKWWSTKHRTKSKEEILLELLTFPRDSSTCQIHYKQLCQSIPPARGVIY